MMSDLELREMEFEIEYEPRETCEGAGMWWASAYILDYGARPIACGVTPWEAIRNCITNIPKAIENEMRLQMNLERAKRGEATCPGCGTLRPPMKLTDGSFWSWYCSDCF